MDWTNVRATPKYNPFTFQLCRHLCGLAKCEFAKKAGLTTKRYSDIETGNVLPTESEFNAILQSQSHATAGFFEKYPTFELDISKGWGENIPINYYKYKVFRDLNPSPLSICK